MSTLLVRCKGQAAVLFASTCLLLQTNPAQGADITRLEAAAQRGSAQKQLELGKDYFVGRGVQRNEELAAYWFEKAANSGDPVAQEEIGYFYQAGIGVARDPQRAAHWFQLAAASGSASAKVNLGVSYLWGLGVPRDEKLAMQLFQQALDKGSATAASYLGEAYFLGIGVPKDLAAAERWFAVGAKIHDPHSEYRLADFLSAPGKKQDLRKAAGLLREASNAGFVPAKHGLGLLIANHPELATKPNESIQNLEEAAAAGVWKSSVVLGALARDGRLVPADAKAAYLHFKIAQVQGGDEARTMLAADLAHLASRLSADDLASLDSQAASWAAKHSTALDFVYQGSALAMTSPNLAIHTGRLMPNPD